MGFIHARPSSAAARTETRETGAKMSITYTAENVIVASNSTRRRCSGWIDAAAKAGYRLDPDALSLTHVVAIGAALRFQQEGIQKSKILDCFHRLLARPPAGDDWLAVTGPKQITFESAPHDFSLKLASRGAPVIFDPQSLLERLNNP